MQLRDVELNPSAMLTPHCSCFDTHSSDRLSSVDWTHLDVASTTCNVFCGVPAFEHCRPFLRYQPGLLGICFHWLSASETLQVQRRSKRSQWKEETTDSHRRAGRAAAARETYASALVQAGQVQPIGVNQAIVTGSSGTHHHVDTEKRTCTCDTATRGLFVLTSRLPKKLQSPAQVISSSKECLQHRSFNKSKRSLFTTDV